MDGHPGLRGHWHRLTSALFLCEWMDRLKETEEDVRKNNTGLVAQMGYLDRWYREEEAETHSYRNVILQALGAHNNVNVEVNTVALCQLDTLVLCSDGLSGKMHADEIARIVNEAGDFKSACQSLINLANERGGEDNITVVVAQFSGAGLPLPDTDSVVPTSLARSPDTPTEINWTMGAKTDPLDDLNSASPRSPSGEARKTEPLPPPPKQSTPFTTPLTRPSSERSRTNDLSDRVGPITAVFAPEEFEEDSRTTAEQKNPNPTTPLDSRYTKPISASPSQPMPEPNAAATPSLSNALINLVWHNCTSCAVAWGAHTIKPTPTCSPQGCAI